MVVHTDRVAIERTRAAGPVHVGYQFWKRLGMDDILGALKYRERAIQLTCATLARVEAAFRAMKSPLAERPIFHRLQHRVEAHISLCVLAYHLLVAIETTLLAHGMHTSWATVREILGTHQVSQIVLPTSNGAVLKIRKASTPEPEHLELYRLLGVPTEVVKPKKTWHAL